MSKQWFGFLLIAALCVLAYLLLRTLRTKARRQPSDMQIIGSMPLGQKEKLVVCQVLNKKFIMGVTAHTISHLHTFESDPIEPTALPEDRPPTKHYSPYFT